MNILIIDSMGSALDFAIRCQNAGHKIKWYISLTDEKKPSRIGDGMFTKVPDWRPWTQWADLVFLTDNTRYLKELDALRKRGVPVFGATYAGAELELDREAGQSMLRECGVKIIPTQEFVNYNKAIKFVESTMGRYVSKPSGDADKALSYCSQSPADMIFMLKRWRDANKLKAPFILQEFTKGIEFAVGGWLGPNGFSRFFCENFENKKLMNGQLGPQTGEMGSIIKYVTRSKIADEVLIPCEQKLVDMGITGYVDVNCIVTPDGTPYPLEWTLRPGWPTFNLQVSLHKGDPANWMADLIEGRDSLDVSEDVCTGVVVAIPDFPYSNLTKKEVTGFPIYHTEDVEPSNLHFCEVMLGTAPVEKSGKIVDDEMPVTAGDYVLVMTGTDDGVRKSAKQCYEAIDKIEIPNSPFYRTDIGKRLQEQLPELQEMNYCLDWSYE